MKKDILKINYLESLNWKQEGYYRMLVKYREELTKPIQEAADFMERVESQLNTLCNGSFQILASGTSSSPSTIFLFLFLFFCFFGILPWNPFDFVRSRVG